MCCVGVSVLRIIRDTAGCAEALPVSHREGVPGFQCMGCSFQSVQLVEQQHVECNQHHQTNRRTKKTNHVLHLLPGLIQHLQQSVFHLHTQQCKFRTGRIHPDTNGCGANYCSKLHSRYSTTQDISLSFYSCYSKLKDIITCIKATFWAMSASNHHEVLEMPVKYT